MACVVLSCTGLKGPHLTQASCSFAQGEHPVECFMTISTPSFIGTKRPPHPLHCHRYDLNQRVASRPCSPLSLPISMLVFCVLFTCLLCEELFSVLRAAAPCCLFSLLWLSDPFLNVPVWDFYHVVRQRKIHTQKIGMKIETRSINALSRQPE